MAIRTRKNVFTLVDAQGQWHPDLLWYTRAVTEMKKRPIADPTSWRYQAAIHDYVRQRDPLAQANDVLPAAAERQRFWGQCQHFSWFFLSWHRMYLFHFEQIVSATIKQLNGPEWALPYWNYSDSNNPDARRVPPAFRATLTPDQTAQSPARQRAKPRLQQRPDHRRRVRHRHQRLSRGTGVCRTRDGRQSRIWRTADGFQSRWRQCRRQG